MSIDYGTKVKIVDVFHDPNHDPKLLEDEVATIKARIGQVGIIRDVAYRTYNRVDDLYPYFVEFEDDYSEWFNEEELEIVE